MGIYVSQQFKPCVIPDHRSVNLLSIVCCTSIEPSDDYSKIALEGKRHNLNPVDHGTWKDDQVDDT
jgi:hypothetical protein